MADALLFQIQERVVYLLLATPEGIVPSEISKRYAELYRDAMPPKLLDSRGVRVPLRDLVFYHPDVVIVAASARTAQRLFHSKFHVPVDSPAHHVQRELLDVLMRATPPAMRSSDVPAAFERYMGRPLHSAGVPPICALLRWHPAVRATVSAVDGALFYALRE